MYKELLITVLVVIFTAILIVVGCDDLRTKLTAAEAQIASLTASLAAQERRIASKDEEGWDLQNQITYKAKELHDMTLGWNKTKEALQYVNQARIDLQYELDHVQYELEQKVLLLEECELELDERMGEVEAWRMNTAGTIHALQDDIDDLTGDVVWLMTHPPEERYSGEEVIVIE